MNDGQKYLNRLLLVLDIALLIAAYYLAWIIKFRTVILGKSVPTLSFQTYMMALILIVPLFVFLNFIFNLYPNRLTRRKYELYSLLKADITGFLIVLVVLYLIKEVHFSRIMFIAFIVLDLILDTAVRNIIRNYMRKRAREGINARKVLLVGYSNSAEAYIDRLTAFPEWGYRPIGILDDTVGEGTEYKGVKVLGRIDSLPLMLPESDIEEVAITLDLEQYYLLKSIVMICEKSGVHTKFIPDYYNIISTKPYTEDMQGLPVIHIRYVPLNNPFRAALKRLEDIIGSLLGIAILSPVMLIAVIGIRSTSKGPLIFRQERVGLHEKLFDMLKFRSMVVQRPEDEVKKWTVENDPRVTSFGRFMRRTNIDEIPQLFNVLKGDMSLVGPRPERPYFVDKFREEIPRYMIKHQVRPGMTGWAQVNGLRGDTSIEDRIEYDLYYIENWTLGLDLKILFSTVFGRSNENAY